MKKYITIFVVMVILFVLYEVVRPIPQRYELIKKNNERIKILSKEIEEAKIKIDKLEKYNSSINDDKKIERLSRNTLNMTKKGEKIYIFVDDEEKNEK